MRWITPIFAMIDSHPWADVHILRLADMELGKLTNAQSAIET